jgi:hypothetical protein
MVMPGQAGRQRRAGRGAPVATEIEQLAGRGRSRHYELLGVAQATIGNLDGACEAFATALAMERARKPGSGCGHAWAKDERIWAGCARVSFSPARPALIEIAQPRPLTTHEHARAHDRSHSSAADPAAEMSMNLR